MKRSLPYARNILVILLSTFLMFNVNAQDSDICPFLEEDGIVTVEMESADISGTYWVRNTNVPNYTGEGYLQYFGSSATGVTGQSTLTYYFKIENTGRYSFKMRSFHVNGENDVWVRFPHGQVVAVDAYETQKGEFNDDWFKVYRGGGDTWTWNTNAYLPGTPHGVAYSAHVYFDTPGVYSVQFSGRETGFMIDRFTLYNRAPMNVSGFIAANNENLRAQSQYDNCTPPEPSGPYVANEIQDQSIEANNLYSFTIPANTFGPEDATFTYQARLKMMQALPAWLNFNPSTNVLSGTPTFEDGGDYYIVITGWKNGGPSFTNDEFKLTVIGNRPPRLVNEIPDMAAQVETSFEYTIPSETFVDDDGHEISYSASLYDNTELPEWLSFDPLTRTFSGTPAEDDIAILTIKITATDGHGGETTTKFDLYVEQIPDITGISKSKNFAFNAYPNPVDDYIIVEMADHSDAATEIILLEGSGRKINLSNSLRGLGSSEIMIDFSSLDLNPGVYYLQVRSQNGKANNVRQIIKK